MPFQARAAGVSGLLRFFPAWLFTVCLCVIIFENPCMSGLRFTAVLCDQLDTREYAAFGSYSRNPTRSNLAFILFVV